eukprot:CAMPEP_0183336082 /NCGR_PEP_ID=MMETSP0164_2-20130417/4174_1 /TAXON_ID=221442 /ORGANISM="Coccolithus pelagicus ssp braarudi, Strain PLY182g" /LENGTH=257 /DNA_ID=CAMNT_0025505545 /DNA_START=25 /DNA_END=798 /DNA_ORIENTATION=+
MLRRGVLSQLAEPMHYRVVLPQLPSTRRAMSAIAVRPLHLLLYQYVDDVEEARKPFRTAHIAAAQASAQRGELFMGGALAKPIDGAVLAFATDEQAEAFAEADPYVQNGIVTSWTVREWSVVVGSLSLPPIPPFVASYEWKRVESGDILPPGLEVQLPLDGGRQRARIPPRWSLRLNVKDQAGFSFTFDQHHDVTRSTNVGELRRALATQASQSKILGDVSAEQISMTIDGCELEDASTVEDLDLFSRASQLKVAVR